MLPRICNGFAAKMIIASMGLLSFLIGPQNVRAQSPSTPTGLTATATSSSEVILSWNASTESGGAIAGYYVYRGGSLFARLLGTSTATSYSDTGLTGGSQYCYYVAAYDTAGNVSSISASACATTPTGASCTYSISANSTSVGSSGASGSVNVTAGSGCNWTAASNVGWITITAGNSGSGNGTVSYSVAANASSIAQVGTITIAGQAFTVIETGVPCSYVLSSSGQLTGYTGVSMTVNVSAPNGCSWTASSNVGWITVTAGTSGSGNGSVSYTVAANTDATMRTGTVTIAGQTFTVRQKAAPCTYSISSTTASFSSAGGSASIGVTSSIGCSWTATSNASWITITAGSSASGNGTVGYTVAPNTSSGALTGTVTIAGQTFTVIEAGTACTYSISSARILADPSGISGSVTVTVAGGCGWSASSGVNWITLTGGNTGSGNGSVSYVVASNPGPCSRRGALTIAGLTVMVTQTAPPDTIAPTVSLTAPANGATASGSLAISATAVDNTCGSGVAKVEFYRDGGVLIGTAASAPYSMAFDTTGIANGTHIFYAKAYDAAGNTASSSGATVTVNNNKSAFAANPELVGFLPAIGTARDVALAGTTAYIAGDTWGLTVVDVSNPTAPRVLTSSNVPFDGDYVAVSGSLACVTGGRSYYATGNLMTNVSGFYVVDVSKSTNAVMVGEIESATTGFKAVAMAGNYAYVACGTAGLNVIDLHNPSSPVIVTKVATPGAAWGVTAAGSYVYVANGLQGLSILNISNPSAPVSVGWIAAPGTATDVAVTNGLAYVATGNSVQIIDVSNPSTPVLRGSMSVGYPNSIVKVKVQNSTLYAAASAGGLLAIDVSNASSPTLMATLTPPGVSGASTMGVAVSGTQAYLANYVAGLAIVNISVGTAPSQTTMLMDWFTGYKVATKPGLAVVTGVHYSNGGLQNIEGLRVLNVQSGSAPTLVGYLEDPTLVFNGVAVTGTYAYVACGTAGLKVVDISRPTSPGIVGSFATPGYAWAVTVVGPYAFVADGAQGISVVNISNPTSPVGVGWIDTPGAAEDIAVVNGLAYVADGNSLQIIDVSNPSSPVVRGSQTFAAGISAVEVKVQNNIAYVAGAGAGLITVDVSNPSSPIQLAIVPPSGSTSARTLGVVVNGSLAYVANYVGGLGVVDVSNPAVPVLRSMIITTGDLRDVAVQPNWLYGADSSDTINVLYIGQ